MTDKRRTIALIIIDGWGHSPRREGNAIALAHTPFYDEICAKYPKTLLAAAGLRVGLTPDTPGEIPKSGILISARDALCRPILPESRMRLKPINLVKIKF
ncbi:MAG: hypothetical protein ABI686_09195 [Acidobacteriota bacterium]